MCIHIVRLRHRKRVVVGAFALSLKNAAMASRPSCSITLAATKVISRERGEEESLCEKGGVSKGLGRPKRERERVH